jgi:hypothetical protein
MPDSGNSEFYFIGAMMVLIVLLCVVSVYVFFRTYKKEMREKERLAQKKSQSASEDTQQK